MLKPMNNRELFKEPYAAGFVRDLKQKADFNRDDVLAYNKFTVNPSELIHVIHFVWGTLNKYKNQDDPTN